MTLPTKASIPRSPSYSSRLSSPSSSSFPFRGIAFVAALFLLLFYFRMAALTVLQTDLPSACMGRDRSSRLLLGPVENDPSYTAALSTLRCLSTPNCFPTSKCRTGVPKKIQRAKQWEEHSFCVSDAADKKDCLVYSFGIHESWEWEEKTARLLHCEVHAFDPTMNHATNLAPGVTFHKLGLQAEGTDMSKTHAAEYDAIDPKLLLTLGEIMNKLGHVDRKLDLLALDCEGCEWGVLRQIACSGESSLVDQLFVEFHFQKNLGLSTPADVVQAAEGINCLWHHRWHVVSIENSGSSFDDWDYTTGVTQVIHDSGFLLYMALQRIPDDQLRPADHLNLAAQASKHVFQSEEYYQKKHKTTVVEEWPRESRAAFAMLEQTEKEAYKSMNKVARAANLSFDKHEQLDEY